VSDDDDDDDDDDVNSNREETKFTVVSLHLSDALVNNSLASIASPFKNTLARIQHDSYPSSPQRIPQ
jgi:hypothetical protein